jgi:N-methylhydantoinase B
LGGRSIGGAGEDFIVNPFYTGGAGARPGKDGLSCTAFPSGVRNTPVEINEASAPIVIWRKEYKTDSGGAGRLRGGLGQTLEFAHAQGFAFAVSKMFDRTKHPARGRAGGGAGATGAARLGDGTPLKGMGREMIPEGARLVVETPGGGGIGEASRRDAEAVARDTRQGFVSPDAAQYVYRR